MRKPGNLSSVPALPLMVLTTAPATAQLSKQDAFIYQRCSAVEMDAELRKQHPYLGTAEDFERWLAPFVEAEKQRMGSRSTPELLTIPVGIHIVHNGDAVGSGENITDAQAISQITVLNNDFRRLAGTPGYNNDAVGADTYIEFCLA